MWKARRSVKQISARLFTLQAKLVIAMTALIVLAVMATGAILVLRSKDEREMQALDRVAADGAAGLPGAACAVQRRLHVLGRDVPRSRANTGRAWTS